MLRAAYDFDHDGICATVRYRGRDEYHRLRNAGSRKHMIGCLQRYLESVYDEEVKVESVYDEEVKVFPNNEVYRERTKSVPKSVYRLQGEVVRLQQQVEDKKKIARSIRNVAGLGFLIGWSGAWLSYLLHNAFWTATVIGCLVWIIGTILWICYLHDEVLPAQDSLADAELEASIRMLEEEGARE
jgi:hypothetical protein